MPGQILPRSFQTRHLVPPPFAPNPSYNQSRTIDGPLVNPLPAEDMPTPRQQQRHQKQIPSAAPINSTRPLVANVAHPRQREYQKTIVEDASINIGMSMMYPDAHQDSGPPNIVSSKHDDNETLHEIADEEEEFNPYKVDHLKHRPTRESLAIQVQTTSPDQQQPSRPFLEDARDLEEEDRRRQAAGSPVALHHSTSRLVIANPSDYSRNENPSPNDPLQRRESNLYTSPPSIERRQLNLTSAMSARQDSRVESPPNYEMHQPRQDMSSRYSDVIQYEDIRHIQPPQQTLTGLPLANPYVSDRQTRQDIPPRHPEVIQYEDIRNMHPPPIGAAAPPSRFSPHVQSPDEQYQQYRRELERERDSRSTKQSISTTSSGQKPLHPLHIPKRLVMPAPLQQSTAVITNQVQQRRNSVAFPPQQQAHSQYRFSHDMYQSPAPSPPGLLAPISGKHQAPLAQDIPMSSGRKLRKRTSILGALTGHEAPAIAAVSFPVDTGYMKPPSGDNRSTRSKTERIPKRLISKRRTDF